MPKINLYRNISLTFIAFMAIIAVVVFLFFSSQATIFIVPNPQKINLSFNLEVKNEPTAADLAEKDIVAGRISTYVKKGSSTFEVLSTKTVDSEIVGQVTLINQSPRNQTLVRTTQLQAENGVIVRTNKNVVVSAGSRVLVDVFAKDPPTFSDIEPGKLVIIKLNPLLQDKIYALVDKTLTSSPREVKVLAESDIKRARDDLSNRLLVDLKKENSIIESSGLVLTVKSFKADKNLGEEADNFNLEVEIEAKVLEINEEQLAGLISKKVSNLDLSGLSIGQIDVRDVAYVIIDDDLDGSVLVKVNYSLLADISEANSLLNKVNLAGKSIKEVEELLTRQETIKEFEIKISPYWRKNLPQQISKIKILIKN
ncbi:MAG: hypothetical protein A3B89_02325 [Candidatus Buchananbacteria bacterium RIFCSPHIGHO2_02_FULL_40_13]|uniref:Baseplate protein J-like domain-containing protein n=1 Tax=Candidatus Buchananbacteria bacterium RIFCSPLOWO2_01_FULL_39_33 TaxID=1797543 RepID=A0A1G1YJ66_9BACT|nr:MAG: hypothetical protein A3B89_02325 [Candidatus Buchananbacteria bacterium RIFCSPHIGHO2_02_FULL_40_13]OGY52392.1 MAG: hypothetical protein A3A02_02825 [Candidatus Buchananbacteria bacterium RIFCSPLOWO2_01_FULL_39_33]